MLSLAFFEIGMLKKCCVTVDTIVLDMGAFCRHRVKLFTVLAFLVFAFMCFKIHCIQEVLSTDSTFVWLP